MNENAQKIIDSTSALYVFTLLFNVLSIKQGPNLRRGEFNFKISFFSSRFEKILISDSSNLYE